MDVYEFDSFRFDARTRLLLQNGREIPLPRKTADLLLLFVQRPGQVILKEELVSSVWPDTSVADNSLTFAIHQLREALGCQDGGGQSYIETFPKRGYRLVATVKNIHPEQVRTSVPLSPVEEPAKEAIQDLQRQSFAKDQQRSRPRRLTSFAMIGAVALLVLTGGVIEFRLKPNPRLSVGSYSQLTSDGHDKGGVLLTDGARVYFKERGSTGWQLASAAVEGGPIVTLPLSVQATTIFDIAPLRSEILAARTTSNEDAPDLWTMSLLGGPPRRVGALKADAAVWSPDKTRIASVLGTGLFISASDGTGTRKIATIPAGSFSLSWSPDEKTLRFSRGEYRNGDVQQTLWQVNVDGTSLHQLLAGWNNPPHECCGSWTPDGSFYVFRSTRYGHNGLWAIPERPTFFGRQSSAPVRFSSGPLEFSGTAVSTDGKQIFAIGMQERGELVSYKRDLHDFVKFLGGISAIWISFARSGQWVAYIDYPSLTIWRAKADGRGKTQITFSPLQVDGFSWSPDEKWFAIRARNPGDSWRIYLIPSQGGELEPLTPGESEQGVPTWSADNARLCFGDVPAVFGKPGGSEMIHIFDLRTHKLSDLPGSQGLWTSRWSPDGRYISALTIEGQKLKLFNFSTNTWRSTNAVHVNNPNWTTDSKFIYYDTEANDRMLQRVRISDGKVEQLANLRDYPAVAAWWSGLSPNNEPLLMRNLSSSEIYSLALEYK